MEVHLLAAQFQGDQRVEPGQQQCVGDPHLAARDVDRDHAVAEDVFGVAQRVDQLQHPPQFIPEILFQPHWGKPWIIDYPEVAADADHGGGDELILQHLFRGVKEDPLGLAADNIDGAKSILVGIAGNESMRTGLPVKIDTLVKF